MNQKKALIFSAPSGAGKTTIVKHLLKTYPSLSFSISACTRKCREQNENKGKDYYFLSLEEFKEKINNQEFIEWEEVYPNKFYGTLKSEINRIWNEDKHIIFDVDIKGGLKLKEYFKEKALTIFVKTPSIEILKKRLGNRKTETEENLSQRVLKSKLEMKYEKNFDTVLMNDKLEVCLSKAEALYTSFINSNEK